MELPKVPLNRKTSSPIIKYFAAPGNRPHSFQYSNIRTQLILLRNYPSSQGGVWGSCICVCLSVCLPACLPACLYVCMSVCLSVCVSVRARNSKKLLLWLTCCFYTRSIIPVARSSSKMIWIWTQEFIKLFFTITTWDKICQQSMPWSQTCVMMKKVLRHDRCVIASESLLSMIALFRMCNDCTQTVLAIMHKLWWLMIGDEVFLCREWLNDVPRRGVAFPASAVHRQFYTGCVDNKITSYVLCRRW